jgi:hypothetical protein
LDPLDDLIRQLEDFELEGAEKMSPREYARFRKIAPQRVYYYIKNGRIKLEECICGRRVIDKAAADEVFSRARSKPADLERPVGQEE